MRKDRKAGTEAWKRKNVRCSEDGCNIDKPLRHSVKSPLASALDIACERQTCQVNAHEKGSLYSPAQSQAERQQAMYSPATGVVAIA